MIIIHSPICLEYASAGHPERPARIQSTVALLRKQSHTWIEPTPCNDDDLKRVHSLGHIQAVATGNYFDGDTPHFPNIDGLARLAAGAAIQAATLARAEQRAFSLMRPPGHHATQETVMGFCYFNNIAVAVAHQLHHHPEIERVAILDFDCHHGNGTEDIFLGDKRVLFCSVHQAPCYPGTGLQSRQNCLNFPLSPGTVAEGFLEAIDAALGKIGRFKPQMLAVSAGFDAFQGDPITHMGLEIETFDQIGRRIHRAAGLIGKNKPLPVFGVLEGGYADDLDKCVAAFIAGWEQG